MAFVKVAEIGQVPIGGSRVVQVKGLELALFNVDGQIYCIDNVCPHSGGPLGEGYLEGDTVMCPWHAWEFNVRTGQLLHNSYVCVATFPCKIDGGAVLVDV